MKEERKNNKQETPDICALPTLILRGAEGEDAAEVGFSDPYQTTEKW